MARYRTKMEHRLEEEMNENLPVDVLPYSNCEHYPSEPTKEEKQIMKLADEWTEQARKKFGMSRRQFVRTSGAMTLCFLAINRVTGGKDGHYAFGSETAPDASTSPTWDACALDNPDAELANRPGEFVFDVQSHHVESVGRYWALQPVHMAFICGFFGVATSGHAGENPNPCDNVGRWQYIKDIYLDSATTAGVLSPVPSAPDEQQPLPFHEANRTAEIVASLSGVHRVVTHGYVMPNRGQSRVRAGAGPDPAHAGVATLDACDTDLGCQPALFLQDELDWMEQRAIQYRQYLRGWKVYTPYGDIPFSTGMRHDDLNGFAMNDKIRELNEKYGVPKVLASHKGVSLPAFDDRHQASDDVPPAAGAYPDIHFVIYHSAGNSGARFNLYPTDDPGLSPAEQQAAEDAIDVTDQSHAINGLIKGLRLSGLDGPSNIPPGLAHGCTTNVSVDLGSVQSTGNPGGMAIFLGKMIKHLGARRICYGTDAIWTGSPHRFIVALRTLDMSPEVRDLYNLPWGFDGDRFDPRVNALTGQVAGYSNGYSQAYLSAHPALANDPRVADPRWPWPTDGAPHPERSIRNGILGWNASDIYEHDGKPLLVGQGKTIDCEDVNYLRRNEIGDRLDEVAGLGKYHPLRSNMIWGPRTKRDTIRMLNKEWKENGWRA